MNKEEREWYQRLWDWKNELNEENRKLKDKINNLENEKVN